MKRVSRYLLWLAILMPFLALPGHAQSVINAIQHRIKADNDEMASRYGLKLTDYSNSVSFYRDAHVKTGGPSLDRIGLSGKLIFHNTQILWWGILALMAMFAFTSQTQGGQGIKMDWLMVWLAKLAFLTLVFSFPSYFYSISMTMKNSFSSLTAMALENKKSASENTFQKINVAASQIGEGALAMRQAIENGVLDAYNDNAVRLAGDALPATIQIYNSLAAGIDGKLPFDNIKFPTVAANDGWTGDAPDMSKFDGKYISSADTDPLKSSQAYMKVAKDESFEKAQSKFNYVVFDAAEGNKAFKTVVPNLLTVIAFTSNLPSVAEALRSNPNTPTYAFGQALIAPDAIKRIEARVAAKESLAWAEMVKGNNHGSDLWEDFFVALETHPKGFSENAQKDAAKEMREYARKAANSFIWATFVAHYKHHNLVSVRGSYRDFFEDKTGRTMKATVDAHGMINDATAKGILLVVREVSSWIRWAVIIIFTRVTDLMLEANILLLWLAGPLWLFDKTSRGVTTYLNGVLTGAFLVPVFTFLLTVWDGVVAGFVSGALFTNIPDANIGTMIMRQVGLAFSGITLVAALVMSITGILGAAFITPKVAKSIFEGTSAIGAMMGAGIAAMAATGAVVGGGLASVAGGPVGAAVASKVAAASGSVGSKIAGSKIGKAMSGIGSKVASAMGGGEGASPGGGGGKAPVPVSAGLNNPSTSGPSAKGPDSTTEAEAARMNSPSAQVEAMHGTDAHEDNDADSPSDSSARNPSRSVGTGTPPSRGAPPSSRSSRAFRLAGRAARFGLKANVAFAKGALPMAFKATALYAATGGDTGAMGKAMMGKYVVDQMKGQNPKNRGGDAGDAPDARSQTSDSVQKRMEKYV